VAFPILQEAYRKTVFAAEKSWRESFTRAGFGTTLSHLDATFLISKQTRADIIGFGRPCALTQLFNHIPGQAVMSDKVSVVRRLRESLAEEEYQVAAAEGQNRLTFEQLMPITFVFDGANFLNSEGGQGSIEANIHEWLAFRAAVIALGHGEAEEVQWIHKKRGVENNKGITLLSYADLREAGVVGFWDGKEKAAAAQAAIAASMGKATAADHEEANTHILYRTPGVIQRYMTSPLLLHGRKVDFRAFVLVASVKPLAAFFHDDFMARVSPFAYSNRAKGERGLTAVASMDQSFLSGQEKKAELENGQWSPQKLALHLFQRGETGFDEAAGRAVTSEEWLDNIFRPKLVRLASALLHTAIPALAEDAGYFGFYGLDVLVDKGLTPYFSELNFSPELSDVGAGAWKKNLNQELTSEIIDIEMEVIKYRIDSALEVSGGKGESVEPELMPRIAPCLRKMKPIAFDKAGTRHWAHLHDIA
jgi:hypothetical protein